MSKPDEAQPTRAGTVLRGRWLNWQRALGELAIVVVGILIALAVNDWAEARRERALEARYLERLLADSSGNLATIQERMAMHTRRAGTLARLSASFRDGSPGPAESEISDALCLWFIQPALPLRRGTYAELVSSGNLALLRDVELRALLEGAEARHAESLRVDRAGDGIAPDALRSTSAGGGKRSLPRTEQNSGALDERAAPFCALYLFGEK